MRPAPEHSLDELCKFARARKGLLLPPSCDGARHRPRPPFLSKDGDYPLELALLEAVDHVGSAETRPSHAHVERSVLLEGEAALGLVDLHRRHADIEHDAVNLPHALRRE